MVTLILGFDRVGGVGYQEESILVNKLFGGYTDAIGAVVDSQKGSFQVPYKLMEVDDEAVEVFLLTDDEAVIGIFYTLFSDMPVGHSEALLCGFESFFGLFEFLFDDGTKNGL